jgi:hypothetical protein
MAGQRTMHYMKKSVVCYWMGKATITFRICSGAHDTQYRKSVKKLRNLETDKQSTKNIGELVPVFT